jgi:hypothetical protein
MTTKNPDERLRKTRVKLSHPRLCNEPKFNALSLQHTVIVPRDRDTHFSSPNKHQSVARLCLLSINKPIADLIQITSAKSNGSSRDSRALSKPLPG